MTVLVIMPIVLRIVGASGLLVLNDLFLTSYMAILGGHLLPSSYRVNFSVRL